MTRPNEDEIMFTVTDDGRIKVETGKISGANHVSADELLASVSRLAGGEVKRSKRKGRQERGVVRTRKEVRS